MEDPVSGGWIGIDFIETDYFGTSLLEAGNIKSESNYDDWRTVLCESAADPKCQIPDYHFTATAIFSPCTDAITINCVESVNATLADGTQVTGKVKRLWNPQGEYKGEPLLGIPDGGQASTWTLTGTNTINSDEYVLIAGVRGGMPIPQVGTQFNEWNKFQGQLFAYFQPVKEITGNFQDPKMVLFPRGTGGIGVGGGLAHQQGCFMNDVTTCAQKRSFPLDVKYSLTMRFERPISPWLNGRVVDPSISFTEKANGASVVTISAKPMRVPEVGGYIKWSDTPEWMKAKYPSGTGGTARTPDGFTTKNLDSRILKVGAGSAGTRAIKEFQDWIPFLQDKPFAMKTYWNVKAITDEPSQKMRECAQSRFAGIVSSNSAVFSSGAPSWNIERETLDYTVGAPHYDTEGKLLTGQYVLSMRSDVARCIYGFSAAPISARVEIASEDGSPNLVTTTINENPTTGMLTLTASGFHYSTPQLSVKFLQEKKVVPTPTPSPTATAKAMTIKKITCVKGKVKKTVKGTNPRCPSGYKKS
jgi:muconolactone delta-isomerase